MKKKIPVESWNYCLLERWADRSVSFVCLAVVACVAAAAVIVATIASCAAAAVAAVSLVVVVDVADFFAPLCRRAPLLVCTLASDTVSLCSSRIRFIFF